jgi:hypothetical protein
VTELSDPYQHIPGRSQDILRRSQAVQNHFGAAKQGDPVDELARELLEREAISELRYATCPACHEKNPDGIASIRTDRRQNLLFGWGFFGIVAGIAWFYPWAALVLPGMDLLVFRPIMFVQARKTDKPFPFVPFIGGITFDFLLIALILRFPRYAPLIPLAGIVQSIFTGSAKYDWRWDDAQKKLRFDSLEKSAP